MDEKINCLFYELLVNLIITGRTTFLLNPVTSAEVSDARQQN